jgi:hypothetical protein
MKRLVLILAVAIAALIPGVAGSISNDNDPPVVEALVVIARIPGPPWWRVTHGASTVYILGLPSGPTPSGLRWDQSGLTRRLTGANLVILPPTFTAGLRDIPALLRVRAQLRTRTPLAQQLPPALNQRFQAAEQRLRQPPSRYEGWDALIAAQMLRGDYLRQQRLSDQDALNQVVRVARSRRLPQRAFPYAAMPVLRSAVGERSAAATLACVEGSLQSVEASAERYRAAAQGWANGDVRRAIDVPHGIDLCAEVMLEGFVNRSTADEVAAVDQALQRPGRAVALIPIRRLVTRGGVVEQLRARGYQVFDPASRED